MSKIILVTRQIPVVKAGEVAAVTPRMKRRPLRIYWIFQKILKNPLRKLRRLKKKRLIQSLQMTHLNHIFSLA